MQYKPDLQKSLERLSAFWERELVDRVCISVKAPKAKGINISPFINEMDFGGDYKALVDYWTNPETILQNRSYKFANTFFGGEALPAIFQNYGTSGHCNYYGAKPRYGQDTIWFDPAIQSLGSDALAFHPEVLDAHLQTARYLTQHANGQFFVGMPDSCGTLDAICHLYGSENVLYAFNDEPDELKQAVRIVNQGWKQSCEAFYQVSRQNCNGSVHAWMDLWAPGRIMQMQCDLSVMLSAETYKEFVLPELLEQVEWIEYPVYHFDGVEQIRHLDSILSIQKLKAIQWTAVAGQPSAVHYIDTLQRIQAAGKGLIVMTPKEDVPALLDNLSPKGLYLHCEAEDEAEAREILRYAQNHTK